MKGGKHTLVGVNEMKVAAETHQVEVSRVSTHANLNLAGLLPVLLNCMPGGDILAS